MPVHGVKHWNIYWQVTPLMRYSERGELPRSHLLELEFFFSFTTLKPTTPGDRCRNNPPQSHPLDPTHGTTTQIRVQTVMTPQATSITSFRQPITPPPPNARHQPIVRWCTGARNGVTRGEEVGVLAATTRVGARAGVRVGTEGETS